MIQRGKVTLSASLWNHSMQYTRYSAIHRSKRAQDECVDSGAASAPHHGPRQGRQAQVVEPTSAVGLSPI